MREVNDTLISQFIDDELELDEKIDFVNGVRSSADFAGEAVDMLVQEKMMSEVFDIPAPAVKETAEKAKVFKLSFANSASAAALAASLILVVKVFFLSSPAVTDLKEVHRFVLHMPDAGTVSLAGSFSGWENLPMQRIGSTGYWQLSIPITKGEHQYSFFVDGDQQIADPTVTARQKDDFGGENSILKVGERI